MKERRQLVELWRKGKAQALVTLVRLQGSSYRRPGARMLISGLHGAAGTISGGCLEAEMIRKAPWLVQSGAVVERISTLFDDTDEVPFGLGCGGVIDLLVEPAETPECAALLQAMEDSLEGRERRVVTWLPEDGQPLRRAVMDTAGSLLFASPGLSLSAMPRDDDAASDLFSVSAAEVFTERLATPQRLVVFGAGEDAKPLVSMAALLGWDVDVLDGRPQLARPERFPEAARVAVVTGTTALLSELRAGDAVVVMSHSYEQDREAIAAALQVDLRYVGLLGARHRSALLLSEAADVAGVSLAECCARVHAPVGLDLGGDGPEAVALSVISEVQACCMGRALNAFQLAAEDVLRYVRESPPRIGRESHCALDVA